MTTLSPLESRSLSTGLAQRTLKNLDFIKQAFACGEDVHLITQTVNSLLGLLVFPVEREAQFFRPLQSVSLDPPEKIQALHKSLPGFPPLPSLVLTRFEDCGNLGRFLKRLRNAIAHRRLDFSNDSRDLDEVLITMRDGLGQGGLAAWEIIISAADLEKLSRYIASSVIENNV
jgi:hypothetical protein